MRIAVVGGGINGVMCAASLRTAGHDVILMERSTLMSATSSASTKLLHGGLRYLEHGSFRLVREALHERRWWLDRAPELCHPLQLLLPVWKGQGRSRHLLRAGLWMYDLLAGSARLKPHRWMNRSEALEALPGLRPDDLVGAFSFWDGQMDDLALGLWAAERARGLGVVIREGARVERVSTDGVLEGPGIKERFDRVVNCAGPWAEQLLRRSGLTPRHTLDLVRGSHLVVDRVLATGVLAQVPGESRIAFLLPWKGRMLLGTTEVRQSLDDPIACSTDEAEYLRRFHDSVMLEPLEAHEISSTFAGVRPLIRSADDPGRATREYALERHEAVLTVFGGKWTTARALGELVASRIA
jgi:glycerol-3-phosphate dehydrogenase